MTNENLTDRQFPGSIEGLERQVYYAMRARGWIIPQTDEDVLRAEIELAHDRVTLPADLADPFAIFNRGQKESAVVFAPQPTEGPLPLLGILRKYTGLRPSAIARAMHVSVAFLSAVARYPKAVPESWRLELAARAERIWQIARSEILASFEHPFTQAIAASRNTPYAAEAVSYHEILDRSGLSPEAREFWLKLAAEKSSS
jgi:hypothetical protein